MKGGHGPTKQLSDSGGGAFDHAPQSLSENYYLDLGRLSGESFKIQVISDFFCDMTSNSSC